MSRSSFEVTNSSLLVPTVAVSRYATVVSGVSVVIEVLGIVDVEDAIGVVSRSSLEEVKTVLEGEVTIVVLGDLEALDVSLEVSLALISKGVSVDLESTILVKVVCRETSVDLELVERSWVVVGMANSVNLEIVAVAKVSVIPSAVVVANVENSNKPTKSKNI